MITNNHNIPLSLAIWLLHDEYDYNPNPNVISATALLKPIRALVLGRRIPSTKDVDLMDLVPSRMGSAIHTAVERAWDTDVYERFEKLGYAKEIIDKIEVNPKILGPGEIPIYMEQRRTKPMGKWVVSGKFDFVIEGILEDFKSTSTWAWVFQSNVEKYIEQGSIYRWLNPDIITEDYMNITYIFTDWSATKAKQDKSYPQARVKVQKLILMTIPETESFIRNILTKIDLLEGSPDIDLPLCTKDELWQKDTVWKYYKDPTKTVRSTKNFDNAAAAYARLSTDGNSGAVVEVPGEAKHCHYCNASPVCTQREQLELSGVLKT